MANFTLSPKQKSTGFWLLGLLAMVGASAVAQKYQEQALNWYIRTNDKRELYKVVGIMASTTALSYGLHVANRSVHNHYDVERPWYMKSGYELIRGK